MELKPTSLFFASGRQYVSTSILTLSVVDVVLPEVLINTFNNSAFKPLGLNSLEVFVFVDRKDQIKSMITMEKSNHKARQNQVD